MFKTIVKKEILENILSYRFPLFALLAVVLIPLAMYVNTLDYAQRIRDYNEQVRLAGEAVASIKMQDMMAGTVAVKGFRRPSVLSVYTRGFENTLPAYYEFSQEGSKPGGSSGAAESILSVQGRIDFVFLIQMVLSVIGLVFASDVIAGEKESGTLRAMLSNRLPRDTILLGKIAGGAAALFLPFLLAFLIGLFILSMGGTSVLAGGLTVRILIVFLAAAVFLLGYYTLGTMISASSAKSRTALVGVFLVWTFFQLIVPKLSDMIAGVVYPVRTETQVTLEKSLLAKNLDTELARELGRQYDLIIGWENPSKNRDDPNSPERQRWDALKSRLEMEAKDRKASQLGRIDEAYLAQKQRQQRLAVGLSLVSPSAAFARFVADVCNTGELERAKYADAVKSQEGALAGTLWKKVKRTVMINPKGGTALGFQIDPKIDMKALPAFSIRSAGLAEVFKANWKSLFSLGFWLIAPFAVAYIRFVKYDVR